MLLHEFLENTARRLPGKTALICGEQRLTYAEIDQLANRLAHGLLASGVRRGDRVAVCLDNSVEAVISVWAILKAGGVFMMINASTKSDKLSYVLNNSRATALITTAEKIQQWQSSLLQSAHLKTLIGVGSTEILPTSASLSITSWTDLLARHPDGSNAPPNACIDVDLASLIYTSGSTGDPKGVMVTHLNMVAAATSITTYLRNTEDDIVINVLPLSFDYGLYQLIMVFKFGGTLVLERTFAYPAVVLKKIAKERVTGLPVVPMIAAMLIQMDLTPYDFSSLRYLSNTGAAMPVEHIRKLRLLFPKIQIFSMFGLTECKRVGYLPPEQIDIRPGSVGHAMPNVETWLVDEQNNRLPNNSTGELVVRGSNVMSGYWEKPEETAKMLRPGPLPNEQVLYTGDIFRTDEEGYLYFLGRRDDIIKSRGEKVSPKEVENVLHAMPGIVEAAVIGVPDPVLGQAVKAVVVASSTAITEKDILRYCAAHLEDFMVPKLVEIRESMPRTSSGKINKRAL